MSPILNTPPLQNRHFDQFSSFGMISGCLRNDIGIVLPEKPKFTPKPFFEFSRAILTPNGLVFKIRNFVLHGFDKK